MTLHTAQNANATLAFQGLTKHSWAELSYEPEIPDKIPYPTGLNASVPLPNPATKRATSAAILNSACIHGLPDRIRGQ